MTESTEIQELLRRSMRQHQAGQFAQAEAELRRAIDLEPTRAEYQANLGAILASQKKWEQAAVAFREAIALRPDLPEAHHSLGRVLLEAKHIDLSIAALRRAIELRPQFADALHNLGGALLEKGDAPEAIAAYERALAARPNFPPTLNNLANVYRAVGEIDLAIHTYGKAIASGGESPEVLNNLGIALYEKGAFEDAAIACRRALTLKEDFVDAHLNLGNILRRLDRLDEAIAEYRRTMELRPESADALANLATALRETGLADESLECYRKAMTLSDQAWIGSAYVFTINSHPDFNREQIREEDARWNERYAGPLAPASVSFENDRNADRRLRIGYVSPDFRWHSQSQFTVPLLSHHDREQFEIFCYSNVAVEDEMTGRIKTYADQWRSIAGRGDDAAVHVIREDRIDVLVDLTMHMDRNRLLIFAGKPAPVQVTWLAYPGTTGLTAIDYRLTDPQLDPPGEGDQFYSEKSYRLPDTFWCYDPLASEPPVNELPALSNGFVTFGCLNNFAKVTDLTLDVWSRVLKRVTRSRLLLLAPNGSARQRIVEKLENRGVEEDRIEFISRQPRAHYLASYHRIDLCLDTFPYNGHTTTLDSAWMGVVPLTMPGATAVSRGGLSILSNVGLQHLVARDADQLVEIAGKLTSDLPALAKLRSELRKSMEASPLMDAKRFARDVETAYRQMWRKWIG